MYLSIVTLLIVGVIVYFYLKGLKQNSDNNLDVLNLICAVAFIERNVQTHKGLEDNKHYYAFLIQYLEDMQNLKVKDLNDKWIGIYNFFLSRTRSDKGGQLIEYTKHGRINPRTIKYIADLYKGNSTAIGGDVWEESVDYYNELGKSELKKGEYYYPETIDELVEGIEIYDKKYTGHVMMPKR